MPPKNKGHIKPINRTMNTYLLSNNMPKKQKRRKMLLLPENKVTYRTFEAFFLGTFMRH